MKPFTYKETDPTRRCKDCNQPLKKNLLARNPNAIRCNTCHKLKSKNENFNRKRYEEKQRKLQLTHQ